MLSEDHGSKVGGGYDLDLERRKELARQITSSSHIKLAKGSERIIGIFSHKTAVAFKRLAWTLRAE